MELPQPRPFGTQGRMTTHDFLSLYSPVQDPRPSQGNYLKTHDFLQPLEEKNSGKEENTVEITAAEKAQTPYLPPSVEHLILPGGIGTYSTSQISYFNQRVPKTERDVFAVAQATQASSCTERNEENSNCSSYSGSGFTLWEESAVMKGKTGKENNKIAGDTHVTRESGVKIGGQGQWMTLERPSGPSRSSSNNHHHCNTTTTTTTTTFSSLSSSKPSSSQKNQSFMDMIKFANVANDEDDDDEEEFVFKKELSPHLKNDLTVKVMGGKSTDQKPNTPRSKHSATEQRRRSKINDRFQMLREFIPHSDQKRDKASFLLEVIEYIQYLQEKVHKHEGSYQGWNHEPELMPWRNNHKPDPGFVDQSRAKNSGSDPALMFAVKYEENNINVSPTNPMNGQNAVEYKMSSVATSKAIDHQSGLTNMAVPRVPLQPNIFTPGGSCSAIAPVPARMVSDTENVTSQPQSQFRQSRSCTADCAVASKNLKEQEMSIESGTINISTAYSQGLLNTLTQALQSSGVDLSQASISVQIDLRKPLDSRPTTSMSAVKDNEIPSRNPVMAHSRGASDGEESDRAPKRLKTRV